MKAFISTSACALLLMLTTAALADDGRRIGGISRGHGHSQSYGRHLNRYAGHHRSGHRYGHSGYRSSHHGYYSRHHYRPHRYYSHSYRRSDRGAHLLGGVLLGSLLTNAYHNSNDRYDREHYDDNDVYYSTRYPRGRVTSTRERRPSRHLYRDIDGNCFDVERTSDGEKILTALPAEECDW